MLDHPHHARAEPGDEGLLDGRARGIPSRMQDARIRVRRLEALHERALGVAVEGDAEVDELADARRTLFGQHAHGDRVIEPRTGGEGVADVVLDAIVVEHDARDAALGVARVGVLEHVLRHERDAASVVHGVQRRDESGDAAPDDDDVRRGHDAFSQAAAGAAGGFAASMRSSARRAGSATSAGTVMRLRTCPSTRPSSTQAR